MEIKGKKILLTGATGFVGGHVAESLINSGAQVFCLIRNPKIDSYFYQRGLHKKATIIKADLTKGTEIKKVLAKYQFDFIFHLAGTLRPQNLEQAILGNVAPVINLLEAAKQQKHLSGVLLASSTKSDLKNLSQEFIQELALRPYDFSKTAADLYAQNYCQNKELPVVIVKYSNVFGPGDNLVKPLRLTAQILTDLKQGKVFVSQSKSTTKVDFVYVKDVAKFFISTAKNIQKDKYKTVSLKPLAKVTIADWVSLITETIHNKQVKTNLEKALWESYNLI